MSYQNILRYLNSFADYEKNINYSYKKALRIQRIEDFLSIIGNPQKFLRVIHIAGTKGKGSTCAFIAYILREAGFSVGLYTSPHLHDFRERIRILNPSLRANVVSQAIREASRGCLTAVAISSGIASLTSCPRNDAVDFEGMISQKELSYLVKELKPVIDKYNRLCQYGPLTFFEVYTAIAFLYFRRKKVDFAVLETGLGGRLDATNTVSSLVQVITPISYEHTQKLGKTLAEIATEKAGIIKPVSKRTPIVITAPQKKEALRVIQDKCKNIKASLRIAGNQIKSTGLKINLIGRHQLINAACAVGAVEALCDLGFKISRNAICRGLKNTRWPGRCEVIGKNPLIVLDGAQNLASAQVLKKAIKENFSATSRGGPAKNRGGPAKNRGGKYEKLILVLGISDDKDISRICRTLNSLADEIIITRAASKRAADPKKISINFKRKLYLTKTVKEAKILAINTAGKKDLILVTGSLFMVGEFRSA